MPVFAALAFLFVLVYYTSMRTNISLVTDKTDTQQKLHKQKSKKKKIQAQEYPPAWIYPRYSQLTHEQVWLYELGLYIDD
jgi:hypothetical protein